MSKVCDDKPMDFDYVLLLYLIFDLNYLLSMMVDIRNICCCTIKKMIILNIVFKQKTYIIP